MEKMATLEVELESNGSEHEKSEKKRKIMHSARTKEYYVLGVGARYSTYVAKKTALKPDNAPIHPAFKGFSKSEK